MVVIQADKMNADLTANSSTLKDILFKGELPWINSVNASSKTGTVKKKTRSSTKIPHQILLDAAQYIDDEYWHTIVTDMAHHKYPKGFIVKNGVLSYKRNINSIFSVVLEGIPANEVADKVIEFLQQHGNMKSDRDREHDQIIADSIKKKSKEKRILSWKDLKSSKKKNIFLMNYAISLTRDKPALKYEDIYSLLCSELLLKRIQPEHIVIKDNKIHEITVLKYEDGKYYVDSDCSTPPKRYAKSSRSHSRHCSRTTDKISYIKPISISKYWDNTLKVISGCTGTRTKTHREVIMETLSEIERESSIATAE